MNSLMRCGNFEPRRAPTLVAFLAFVVCGQSWAQETPGSEISGPRLAVGAKIPQLQGLDQFGKKQDFDSLKGPKGLVILFFRSADW
jgi:hypothetical protein